MSHPVAQQLSKVLDKIDRPGSFCCSGSVPVVLPGLDVAGLGPIGLPLTPKQAKELKKHCQQAPYGKGEETLVDTSVRRVWELKPERFALTNPDWEPFLQQMVHKVQEELGLEEQKLESHLYDLLLYEPGSFFLPHRDGEKLQRMVATMVVVLPSSYEGGELVVRHEGQEQTIDFSSDENSLFRVHFAAFYADCEHEIRPLRKGYRLCLVYNLALAKSKTSLGAPRTLEYIEPVAKILRDWAAKDAAPRKLAVTLDHQYTQDGLTWDALKGVDRVKARVLLEAAARADCQAFLALLTFHESGGAEYTGGGGYGRRRRWYDDEDDEDDEDSEYEMTEVYETSLTAEHWSDSAGKQLPFGPIDVEPDEVLDPEVLEAVDPEEDFEGYTGNAGMTLDRWYRHGALFLWPSTRQFDVLCDGGVPNAVAGLDLLVKKWRRSSKKEAAALHAQGIDFAGKIIARWPENAYGYAFYEHGEPSPLLPLLVLLDEPQLIKAFLAQVMTRDASIDPGNSLVKVVKKHGWETYQPELVLVFENTTVSTLERNVRLLEQICLAKAWKQKGWPKVCGVLAQSAQSALEKIDQEKESYDYRGRDLNRAKVLAGLARSLLAAEQFELLGRLVTHTLAQPKKYPLTAVHVAALTTLQPWLEKNVKKPCPPLAHWIDACCEQLEGLTAQAPQAPTDFRRSAAISRKGEDCAELQRFLDDPLEQVHRFSVREDRRRDLENIIRQEKCDLDFKTERRGSPYTLVCTKNTASNQAALKKYHQDQEDLAVLRSIQASLPK
jgi:2OG-Fe(II) oxygenase superfamily